MYQVLIGNGSKIPKEVKKYFVSQYFNIFHQPLLQENFANQCFFFPLEKIELDTSIQQDIVTLNFKTHYVWYQQEGLMEVKRECLVVLAKAKIF